MPSKLVKFGIELTLLIRLWGQNETEKSGATRLVSLRIEEIIF